MLEIVRQWDADFIVSRGRKFYPAEIEGCYALDGSGNKVGLVTYEIVNNQCVIVTLDAFEKFQGVGTALLNKVIDAIKNQGVKRIWLITINDNLDAIRFYQKRGFKLTAVHLNALELSRKIKPTIGKFGKYGIPLRDEIEFEMTFED